MKKKRLLKILLIIALVFVLLLSAFAVLKLFTPKVDFTERRDDIFYFPVDYSENIEEDIVYLSKNRDVKFDLYGFSVYITEENYKEQTREGQFFFDYFKAVIGGEYENYKNFFTKNFFSGHRIPKKFTKQKIYDIEVSAKTSDIKDGVVYETYKVSFKIRENNGTYRADVSSGESKPLAFILSKGAEIKIDSIIPIL